MKTILAATLFCLSLNACATAKASFEFSYLKFNLKFPIGFQRLETNNNDKKSFITFLYEANKRNKYITVSARGYDIPQQESIKGCDMDVLLKGAFSGKEQSACNPMRVDIYKQSFVEDRDIALDRKGKYDLYYSLKPGDSYLFIVAPDKTTIRIDSDYLVKSDFDQIVDSITDLNS